MVRFFGYLFLVGALSSVFTVPGSAETVTISGSFTYADAAVVPTAVPTFSLSTAPADGSPNMPVNATITYVSGTFQIQGVSPGTRYSLSVTVDANTANPVNYSGDFVGQAFFDPATLPTNGLKVPLRLVIHLTPPNDNAGDLPVVAAACPGLVVSTQPLGIAWDAVPSAATYDYKIEHLSCPYTLLDVPVSGSMTSTSFQPPLTPNGPSDFYRLTLSAKTALGTDVGLLITHVLDGWREDYRFAIPPPSADLAVSQRVSLSFPFFWTRTCTVEVRNLGPSAASNVVLTDVVPPSWFTPARASGTGWTCAVNGSTVRCSRATMAAGASTRFSIPLDWRATGTNTVTVLASTADPQASNNSASVTITRPPRGFE